MSDSLWQYSLQHIGFPVLHHLLDLAQTHVYWVRDAIQPSHPLLSPSPPALHLPSFLASGSFLISWLFTSGGQSIKASTSLSVGTVFSGRNAGRDSLSLLQGVFPTQGSNPGLQHCRLILYQLSHKGSSRILSLSDLPDPGIELESPAFQADSLPIELSGKSFYFYFFLKKTNQFLHVMKKCGKARQRSGGMTFGD